MSVLKSYKTLVWAKGRKIEGLETRLAQTQHHCDLACLALEDSQAEHHRLAGLEQAGRQQCDALLRAEVFRPEHLLELRSQLDGMQAKAAAAASLVRSAEQAAEDSAREVKLAQHRLQRARSHLETLGQRCLQLEQSQARADEDQQDEESEESAVARMLNVRLGQARSRMQDGPAHER